ncbi:MAG: hypothetical protein ABW190_16480 [Rhizobacter sp.]
MRAVIAQRVIAAMPGGYLLSSAWVAAAGGLFARSGVMARSDAVARAAMLGFVLYLVFMLWAFAQHRMLRLWGVTLGGSAVAGLVLLALSLGR